jgi:hypothetical protein
MSLVIRLFKFKTKFIVVSDTLNLLAQVSYAPLVQDNKQVNNT